MPNSRTYQHICTKPTDRLDADGGHARMCRRCQHLELDAFGWSGLSLADSTTQSVGDPFLSVDHDALQADRPAVTALVPLSLFTVSLEAGQIHPSLLTVGGTS
jgi:hypothetical protein